MCQTNLCLNRYSKEYKHTHLQTHIILYIYAIYIYIVELPFTTFMLHASLHTHKIRIRMRNNILSMASKAIRAHSTTATTRRWWKSFQIKCVSKSFISIFTNFVTFFIIFHFVYCYFYFCNGFIAEFYEKTLLFAFGPSHCCRSTYLCASALCKSNQMANTGWVEWAGEWRWRLEK